MQNTAAAREEHDLQADREYSRRIWNELLDRWERHGLAELEALERQLERVRDKTLAGEDPTPEVLRRGLEIKFAEDGTFGKLSEVERPSDVKEIFDTAKEGVDMAGRYFASLGLDRVQSKLKMTRVMIWYNLKSADVPGGKNYLL